MIHEYIPADVWAEIEAIASAPRYADDTPASVASQPAASVASQPAASVASQPAASVASQPAASVASQPAASVASQSTNNQTNTRRAPSWYVAGCLGDNDLGGR